MSENPPPKSFESRLQDELTITAHEIVQKYAPVIIGGESDHVVWRAPEHPDVVVKVKLDSFRQGLRWFMDNEGTADDFMADPHIQTGTKEYVLNEITENKLLRTYFGRKHILPGRHVHMKVPLLPAIVEKYHLPKERIPDEVYAIALVQRTVPEVIDGSAISFNAWYVREPIEQYVAEMTRALFPQHDDNRSFVEVRDLFPFEPVRRALDMAETHDGVRDFVHNAIRYSNDTGRILDVAGTNNVVFVQRKGEWILLCLDVLNGATPLQWLERTKDIFSEYVRDPYSIDETGTKDNAVTMIINTANYVRFVNNLAEAVGMTERLDYFNTSVHRQDISALQTLLAKSPEAHRARQRARGIQPKI